LADREAGLTTESILDINRGNLVECRKERLQSRSKPLHILAESDDGVTRQALRAELESRQIVATVEYSAAAAEFVRDQFATQDQCSSPKTGQSAGQM
jgi:hypothetical protein